MVVSIVAAATVGVIGLPAGTAGATTALKPLVIWVDHPDPANQQPQHGRLFEYTDFFSRNFTVTQGQIVTFNFNGFHSVALATHKGTSQAAYPTAFPDAEETAANGGPHTQLGPGFSPVQGGDVTNPGQGTQFGAQQPSCGLVGQPVCTFSGGNDFESSGPFGPSGPGSTPWQVQINARPGTYAVYCTIHPGMTATLHVAKPGHPTTSQLTVDRDSQQQFVNDRRLAREAESDANNSRSVTGAPGHRVFTVKVGISAAGGKVAIDEMIPNKPLNLVAGDQVHYVWTDRHNIHSVKFPADPGSDPSPFGFDCASGFVSPGGGPPCTENGEPPEFIFDPGNTVSGMPLTTLDAVVNSGVIAGSGYGIPQASSWSVTTNSSTTKGTHTFHCTIHDFMTGSVVVS